MLPTKTLTILHAGSKTDAYGDTVPDWGNVTETVVDCPVAPRASSEPSEPNRSAVIVGLTAYPPLGTAITARDRAVVDGITYEVVGEPGDWPPFGIEVALNRVEG